MIFLDFSTVRTKGQRECKLEFIVPLAAPMEREARASPAQGEVAKICDFGRRGRKYLAIPQSKIKDF